MLTTLVTSSFFLVMISIVTTNGYNSMFAMQGHIVNAFNKPDHFQEKIFGSPWVLSGNIIQLTINTPMNICGNTVNVIGLLNPAIGSILQINISYVSCNICNIQIL